MPAKRTTDYLSTGQVARLLTCSQAHVQDLCNRGALPSFRLPGSTHRRIRRADLETFCRRHNLASETRP